MNYQPKVSIVMPSLNVAKYIGQTLESVVNQTLKDIEIICVDAGSNDGTMEIIKSFAEKDERITIIISDRKSYGYQMNLGFDAAKGKYLGIVETDDFVEPDMFEKLFEQADRYDLDVVKSSFYFYWSTPEEKNLPYYVSSKIMSSIVFCPSLDFAEPMERVEFYNLKPSIWSAIYNADFIRNNKIRFTETPGASFQDSSFNFKVWALAKKAKLMQDCFLHYRQDNEASSVNSPSKVFCVCDEYAEMERFLEENPELRARLEGVFARLKYDTYIWNFNRLSEELKKSFLDRMSEEFKRDMANGYALKEYFPKYKWETYLLIIHNPDEFFKTRREGAPYIFKDIPRSDNSVVKSSRLKYRLGKGVMCLMDHGFKYTFKLGIKKLKGQEEFSND